MEAVIMAGGKGTRLSSITKNEIPKPMVKIGGIPILEHQVVLMKKYHIKKIYMIIGHLGETIREYFGNGSKWGIDIEYIEETEPLGTGGGLSLLKSFIKDDVLLVYGDLMVDVSITKMYKFHSEKGADVTLFAHPNSHPYDSDIILSDATDKIMGWMYKNESRPFAYHNCVNAGMYIFSSDFVKSHITFTPYLSLYPTKVLIINIKFYKKSIPSFFLCITAFLTIFHIFIILKFLLFPESTL